MRGVHHKRPRVITRILTMAIKDLTMKVTNDVDRLLAALDRCCSCIEEEFEAGRDRLIKDSHPTILRHKREADQARRLMAEIRSHNTQNRRTNER